MSRPAQSTNADVALRLQANGPLTALRLAEMLRVERSTIARAFGRLGDAAVQLGAARRARYALRRVVRTAGDRWPIHRLDAAGRAREWARLHALHGGWLIEWLGERPAWAGHLLDRESFTDGFPFFCGDVRPQGFLGRALARSVSANLRLPADPRQWGDDDILVYLQAEGHDLPGDLILGEAPLRHTLGRQMEGAQAASVIEESARAGRYPDLAEQVTAGGLPGSSAGGEQPKFLTTLARAGGVRQAVLVKFSPPLESASGRRWADLLAAEAQALAVLAEQGLASAPGRLLNAGGRCFLEIDRHDRVGAHGRRGIVSLEALHAAFGAGGAVNDWPAAAESLARAGLIEADGLAAVRRLHAFGELIANVDMHFGNLSFWLDDTLPFRPAPAYDMLPMAWAPTTHGELIERPIAPRPPIPAVVGEWSDAAAWAGEFWRRVSRDPAVSPEFAQRARVAEAFVGRMRAQFAPPS